MTAPTFRGGAGTLCLDFLRTLRQQHGAAPAEELTGPAELTAWIRRFGPCPPPPGAGATDQAQVLAARRLREAVRELITAFRAEGAGTANCPEAARRVINDAAAYPVPAPLLTASGEVRHRTDDPVPATLALIARDALDLVGTPGTAARLHECAGPDCGAVFLDGSRPGKRRWCSMNTCGNRAKKANLREHRPA